jgi:serine protease
VIRTAHLARTRSVSIPSLALLALCSLALALSPRDALAQLWTGERPQGLEPGIRMPGYVPDEALVQLRAPVTREEAEAIARSEGGELAEMLSPEGLIKVRWKESGRGVFQEAARWRKRNDVIYATANAYARGFYVPNDTTIARYDLGWNLRQFDAFSAWDVVTGSPDVVLAIVDAGVAYEDYPVPEYEKPVLWPGVTQYRRSPELPGPFLPGWDFVYDDAHPNDDNGHGTSVATIAAGLANNFAGSAGIAFGVTILPVKVMNYQGDANLDDIIQGIRFAADQGADVINLSLGFAPVHLLLSLGFPASELVHLVKPLRDAIFYAQRRGAIVVGASGNYGADEVSLPAGFPGVIAVGATGVNDRRSSFSSYGSRLDFMAPGGDFLEVNGDHIQDGVPVLSIKPFRSTGSRAKPDSFNVFFFFGTSGAAPHVSGAVALLLSLGLRDQGQIEQTLRNSAVNPFRASQGFDPEYGFGAIRLGVAVRNPVGLKKNVGSDANSRGDGIEAKIVSENPARGPTTLEFRTTRAGVVRIRVYDVRGALVRTLLDSHAVEGVTRIDWDGRDQRGVPASNGVYFLRIETVDGTATRKVAFLR